MQPPVQEVAAPDFYKWEMGYKDLVLKKHMESRQEDCSTGMLEERRRFQGNQLS